jgi:hypothetical protein
MPNYVRHNVVIRGNKEDIARCYEQITKGEEGFSFNNIIPMPESLHVTSGSISAIADTWSRASDEEKKEIEKKKKLTEKEMAQIRQIADNIAKYGYPTWYEWSIDKWGTKWNACDPGCDHDEEEININFDTAWSTPLPVFKELSKQFPDLVIYVEYADEDMGYNCGTYALFKGDIQTEDSRDYEFACDIWGIDPEPEEEED